MGIVVDEFKLSIRFAIRSALEYREIEILVHKPKILEILVHKNLELIL